MAHARCRLPPRGLPGLLDRLAGASCRRSAAKACRGFGNAVPVLARDSLRDRAAHPFGRGSRDRPGRNAGRASGDSLWPAADGEARPGRRPSGHRRLEPISHDASRCRRPGCGATRSRAIDIGRAHPCRVHLRPRRRLALHAAATFDRDRGEQACHAARPHRQGHGRRDAHTGARRPNSDFDPVVERGLWWSRRQGGYADIAKRRRRHRARRAAGGAK